ncbi:major facilitator superfamily domain-containing protein [Cercophora newfieldiana]|uniref:Major facilitator superfamily domain-containing protein n=1 Tax=Cercophora newfieldiana TaxID=92897 RepID=A0AA40CVE8_9PEZI|nr:major facilitator superfamily domain-containing protein [Cercophora newfieldiana]
MGSTLTANLFPSLQSAYHLPPSGPQSVLAASVYLLGFMFGPLIFAPLSESHGRKPVLLSGFVLFILSLVGSAVAPTWEAFLVFRFLTGTFGAPPVSVVGGVIADVFWEEGARGMVMVVWSGATVVGPLSGPVIAGFVSTGGADGKGLGWRWSFWIAVIVAVVSLVAVVALPETLADRLLRDKAARLNKEAGRRKYIAPADVNRGSFWAFLKMTLSRPIRLVCSEMLLGLTCLYLAFVYAIFYMLVKIFPAIFQGIYGFSAGMSGVAFSMMGLGTFIGAGVALWYATFAPSVSAKHPKKREEYLRLPMACVGGPPFVLSLLWLGWSSSPDIHWSVPLLSMLPYGSAYLLIFVAMINYIADAYVVYSASALAACSMTRSIAGALIPLATDKMLDSLGVAWSCTVLAIISAGLGVVPFLFIAYGEKIRAASRFSNEIRADSGRPEGNELTRSISAV